MAKPAHRNRTRRLENSATDVSERQPRLGVRWLHLGSGTAMKLCSTRLDYLWLAKQRAMALSKPKESRLMRREYTPPVKIDF
jgi:hypothetical protein